MTIQLFRLTLFLLICLTIPLTATAQTVDIPAPNLHAITENALGKTSGETVASGIYCYHLSAGDYSATRKMLILK